jgi:hypothetical protein
MIWVSMWPFQAEGLSSVKQEQLAAERYRLPTSPLIEG